MARKADPLIENAYRPHCSWMDGWLIILALGSLCYKQEIQWLQPCLISAHGSLHL